MAHSEETKAKMRNAQKKRFENPVERKKISDKLKNHYSNPKAREKLRAASKRRKKSPAERKKISIDIKRFYNEHPEAREAISLRKTGANNHNWKNGIAPYPKEYHKKKAAIFESLHRLIISFTIF